MFNLNHFLLVVVIVTCVFFTACPFSSTRPPVETSSGSKVTLVDVDSLFKSKFNTLEVLNEYNRPKAGSITHPEPEFAKDEIFYLAGIVYALVQENPNDSTSLTLHQTEYTILKDDYKPELKTFDNQKIFEKIIDKNLTSNVAVLSYVSGNIDSNSKASVIYESIQKVIVNRIKGIDKSKLEKVKAVKWANNVKRIYVVMSVSLNRLSSKKFKKLDVKAKVTGMAFSADGKIFQSAAETSNFYEVILSGFPLDLEQKLETQITKRELEKISELTSIPVDSLSNLLFDPSPLMLLNYNLLDNTQQMLLNYNEAKELLLKAKEEVIKQQKELENFKYRRLYYLAEANITEANITEAIKTEAKLKEAIEKEIKLQKQVSYFGNKLEQATVLDKHQEILKLVESINDIPEGVKIIAEKK